ncbi:MAG: DUF4974 domain-containing protein [Gemmatimonadetes bacterium]|nr:DUF4974 domain-containing protein [Gemmatimonadota bacterium]
MDELILQTLRGEATPAVAEQVRRWCAESPENEAYYRSIALVWAATAPAPLAVTAAPADSGYIMAEAERRRAAEVSGAAGVPGAPEPRAGTPAPVLSLAGRRAAGRRWQPALARGLALAAGIAALTVSVRLLTMDRGAARSSERYAAGVTAPRTVVLGDGSFVRLAANSRIEARSSASERSVTLHGRAFFAVARDAARPFVVRAGGVETRVLGTRFEVAETAGGVRTIVLEGLVGVSNGRGAVTVPAGSLANATNRTTPTVEQARDVRALLDWPGGLLLFQGTPLDQVAREVSSSIGRSVTVEGRALGALRISGSFEQESFEEVVQALCETVGASCRVTAGGASISPSDAAAGRG